MYSVTATNFVRDHQDGRKMLNEVGKGVKFKDFTVFISSISALLTYPTPQLIFEAISV
jgi:hypothetical protein